MRAPSFVLAPLVGAGVLVVDPAGLSPFGPAKWAAIVVIGTAGIAAVLAGGRVTLHRRTCLAWAIFVSWVAVAALYGVDPRLAWLGTPQRHFGALTWLLCAAMFVAGQNLSSLPGSRPGGSRSGDPGGSWAWPGGSGAWPGGSWAGSIRAVRWVTGSAVIVGGLCGAWSLAEWAGWQPVVLAGDPRLGGPLGSASYLGAAEALLLPIAVGSAAVPAWSRRGRLVAAGCAALGLFALIGSGARAAWVGVAASAIAVVIARRGRIGPLLRRRRAWGALAAAALAVVGLACATGAVGRLTAPFGSETVGGLSRLAEWRTAATVLESHPLVGVGPEGYRISFGRAVDASYQRQFGRNPLPDRAHDSLLDVGVTTGIPGLAGYLALLVIMARIVWKALRRGPPELVGVAAGLAAYTLGELFLFPVAELEPAAWLLAGALVWRTASPDQFVTVEVPRLTSMVPAVVAALALVIGVRAVIADQDMKTALAASGHGQAGVARAGASRAVRLDPSNIVLRLAAAEVYSASGGEAGIDAGLSEVSAGLAVSPGDPALSDEAGALLVARAQLSGRVTDWRRAETGLASIVQADPRNPTELLQLGVADENIGAYSAAAAVWTSAAALAPRSPAPEADLALLYQQEGRSKDARAAAVDALRIDRGDAAARLVLDQESTDGT